MSLAIDAAAKLHARQLQAADKGQSVLATGLGRLRSALDKAPELPTAVSSRIVTVAAPVSRGVRRQISFANKSQDLVVDSLEARANGRGVMNRLPDRVANPIRKVSRPAVKLIGSPREIARYSAASARDWTEVRDRYQSTVRSQFSGTTAN